MVECESQIVSAGMSLSLFLTRTHMRTPASCAKSIYGLSTKQLRQGSHFVVQTKFGYHGLLVTLGPGIPPPKGLQRPYGQYTVYTHTLYGRWAGCHRPHVTLRPGTLPPPKVSEMHYSIWSDAETRASALLLVIKVVAHHGSKTSCTKQV